VREWLREALIGEVKMVQANFCSSIVFNPESRLFDPGQGGGALLDLGIYPLSLGSMVYGGQKPERVVSNMSFNEAGTDSITSVILSYSDGRACAFTAGFGLAPANEAVIYGTAGKIRLPTFTFAHRAELNLEPRYVYKYEGDYISNGYNYEAEEVMNCLIQGRIESPLMTMNETLLFAQIMDEIRSQWNFKYPSEL